MPLSPKSQKYKENKAKMMKFWMVTPVVYVSKGQRAHDWLNQRLKPLVKLVKLKN